MKRGVMREHLAEITLIEWSTAIWTGHEMLRLGLGRLAAKRADVLAQRGFDQAMGHDLAALRFIARRTDGAAGRFGISNASRVATRFRNSRASNKN
jgi:hypothetical protein